MFGFIKDKVSSFFATFKAKIASIFTSSTVDEAILQELKRLLISADVGLSATEGIIAKLKDDVGSGVIQDGTDLRAALQAQLLALLQAHPFDQEADIYFLIGVNGTGKTTSAAKLALLVGQKKRVAFVAADTFRAAASDQLRQWAERLGCPIVDSAEHTDPSSRIFLGCQLLKEGKVDALIIDTAGRLQTKVHLMKELEKMRRVVAKQVPDARVATLLTIDALLGQNSLEQAKVFTQSVPTDGIILTKMDGTAKGGIVLAIVKELCIPIGFVTFGEKVEDIVRFDSERFVEELLS